jgi:hypothetical protein
MATEIIIENRLEVRRGCGFRKPGGLYLVSESEGMGCGRLPIRLDRCPCCSAGIKPSRGWTWIDPRPLIAPLACTHAMDHSDCAGCPLRPASLQTINRAGLLWVGGAFYDSPETFNREARELGISRRVQQLPRDFKVGETWVFLAHRHAIPAGVSVDGQPANTPGIFSVFRPQAIEYVVSGKETPETLRRLAARGITLVRVDKLIETGGLFPAINIDKG